MTLQIKNLSNSLQTLHCAVKKYMFSLFTKPNNYVLINRLKSKAQTTDHVIASDLRRLMIPIPNTLDLLLYYLSIANGAEGVGIFEIFLLFHCFV